jgi:molecular chaperone GrpE
MKQNDTNPSIQSQDIAASAELGNESTVEIIPNLADQLQASELKAQEHYDAWMYAKAEGENIRRRAVEDVSKAQKFAVERFSNEMLAVMDSLQAALAVENTTVESFKSGMELTLKQLSSVFEKFHITEINPVGEKLDPHKHQAISMIDSDQPANTVVSVMQKGYALNERILRPALVLVAKAK